MKYGLIGASGKMGGVLKTVMQEAHHEMVFSYDLLGEHYQQDPQILIDFSLPTGFDTTVEYVRAYRVPLVIGTTGLNPQQLEKLQELSDTVPIVQSFNFSVGVNLLMHCIELVKDHIPDWDVEIVESHHRFKKDKPSGTAIMLQQALGKPVNTSSLRLGNVVGEHTISFGGLGEVLSFHHSATSRRTFAEGALRAAYYIMTKQKGLYSFRDVLTNK